MTTPLEEPKPGDLIQAEVFHTGYEDWAIYVEGGYVIHLYTKESPRAGSSKRFRFLKERTMEQQENMKDVFGGCCYVVNNYLDHEYRPQSVGDIINSEKEKVGQKKEYNILYRNCDREHFVNHLDSGQPSQVISRRIQSSPTCEVCTSLSAALLTL
ncbi:phospholipase A and acyltransferase 4-like isoform X1 [Loxodonta africana]|uniref:phospholipase A and acyltransferase 4-like isoform X1 n=1 Tax=Loxodonta africana TaxID=9785 RepID=UPI0030D534A8